MQISYKDFFISPEPNSVFVQDMVSYDISKTIIDDITKDKINVYNRFNPDPEFSTPAILYIPDGHYDGHEIIIENKGYGIAASPPHLNLLMVAAVKGTKTIFTGQGMGATYETDALYMEVGSKVTLKWTGNSWFVLDSTQFSGTETTGPLVSLTTNYFN